MAARQGLGLRHIQNAAFIRYQFHFVALACSLVGSQLIGGRYFMDVVKSTATDALCLTLDNFLVLILSTVQILHNEVVD